MTEIEQAATIVEQWLTVDRAMLLYFVFNSAIQALPDPDESSGMGYRFLFGFFHALAANINVVRRKYPRRA